MCAFVPYFNWHPEKWSILGNWGNYRYILRPFHSSVEDWGDGHTLYGADPTLLKISSAWTAAVNW